MKYTLVLSALTALVAAADKPKFLNSNFQVSEGQPFTFKFDNCAGGCTIVLQNGPSTNLKDVKTVTTTASDGTFTWTPEGVTSGTYAFKITNNANKEFNYSQQFTYVGTGSTTQASDASTAVSSTGTATPSSTAASSTVTSAASQTESSTGSSTGSSTESRTATSTISTVTSAASTTATSLSTTMASSSTSSRSSTSTRSTTSATTTVPNAGVRATPMAFVAGAVAALAYLG